MKKRILVISSANIDFVQSIERMPYSGETIVENNGSYSYVPGGKGANSAITFSRLGADCVFVCKVGDDANGKRLASLYSAEGIDTRYMLVDKNTSTGLASVIVEANGKNRIMVFPGANGMMTAEDMEECFNSYPDAIYLQFEIPDEAVLEACRLANERNIPIFIDAAPARLDFPLRALGDVTIFSPNETECRVYTGIIPNNEEHCLKAAIKLRGMVNAKYIVIKLGDRGAFLFDGEQYYVFESENIDAVDTTAAGDVFTAAMTYYYVQSANIKSAIKFANVAAGLSVSKKGAFSSIPTITEILEYKKAKEETNPE